jgi:hypothetical protein
LTLLAPEIVEAILDGRQPAGQQLDDLLNGFPLECVHQVVILKPGGQDSEPGGFRRLRDLAATMAA